MRHDEAIPVEVAAVEQVTPLVKQFTLRRVDGGPFPPFSGGCHVVVVMHGRGRTFRNPYSLLGSPRNVDCYQIAVRRHDAGRGGSRFMHDEVRVGTRLEVGHPVNLFPLAKLARKHVFVAGGVGITPILAMVDDLRSTSAPWELHYRVRGPEHDHFGRKLRDENGNRVHLYYGSHGQTLDLGRIVANQPLGTHIYTCGAEQMVAAVAQAAKAAGWTDSHVHCERFVAPPIGDPFDVHLARSGVTVHIPSERSLLEAIEAVGVDAPYLCRGGVCGQCETEVLELEGVLVHNDHWLSDEERAAAKKIMPCVSRARCTRLVLDR
ncbi:MAG TPA: PDR/VanB family oxidoreductase [Pirellulales bacterium]|nr:PDR/VanB family oxidoreductase [Pirellulales bacterium]